MNLILPSLMFVIGCHKPIHPELAQDSEPSALEGDLAELHAFAELVGLVHYFHPSDEAAGTPWDLFVIHGAQTLLEEPGFELTTLQGLFSPIAPTVQVAADAPPVPMALPAAGDRVVAWGHRAVALNVSAWHSQISFRKGRSTPLVDTIVANGWISQKLVAPDPLPARWRFTLELSGEPGGQVSASVWEWGEGGKERISRSSHDARAAGDATRSVLVMEHDTGGVVEKVSIMLQPVTLESLTLHKASFEWSDDEGNWTTVPLPLEFAENSETGWTPRLRGYTCSELNSEMVCTRDGTVGTEPTFEVPTQRGEVWQGAVGEGLFASVPLALPGDEAHTYPRGHGPEAEARWRQSLAAHQGSDRSSPALRVASVIQAWTLMRHFHPHPESITGSWESMLDEALADAVAGQRPLPEVIGRLLAHIPDGHMTIRDHQRMWILFPIHLEEVDGRVFVVGSAMPDLVPGDELLEVRGEPVRVVLDRVYASTPGTDQWRRSRSLHELRTAPWKVLTVTVARAGVEETLTLSLDDQEGNTRHRGPFEELGDGIYYLDMRENDVITDEHIATIAGARGLVVELRGYPSTSQLLDHFTPEGTEPYHDWASFALRVQPDEILEWEGSGYSPEAALPYLDLPVVWLTGPRAISASESLLGWARDRDPDARFVGATPTAGANGINHEFSLVGGLDVGWTSMRVTMIDGSPYFGQGIVLDETIPWTTSAVLAGRDPALDAAIDWLQGNRLADPFLGSWRAEDGTHLLVTRDAVNELDSTRWIGRDPILEWTDEGPTLCDRGIPVSGSLARDGDMLTLVRGDTTVHLSRDPDRTVTTRMMARVLPEPPPAVTQQQAAAIAAELSSRAGADQSARSGEGGDMAAIDADNRRWLLEQLNAVGWIDTERFGLQATQDAWLLAQHTGDLGLLMAVAPRLKGVAGLEMNWALMVDRISTKLGNPQRFGSQARTLPDGSLAVLPVTDPEQVAADRLAIGLEPWPVYLSGFEAGTDISLLDCTEAPAQTVP